MRTRPRHAADRPAPPDLAEDNLVVTGPLRRVMLALALPVVAEQFLNTLVGLVDTFLAGRLPGISVPATSAVGLASYTGWLISMLFALVGTGTTALVSRAWGAADRALANRVLQQSMFLALLMGVAGSAGMYLLAPRFARWLAMEGLTAEIAVRYLRIDALSYAVWSWTLVGSAALRGAGDTRTPLKILMVVNAINVVASPALVYGVGPLAPLGVDGIVFGTVLARLLGGLIMVAILLYGRSGLKLQWRGFSVDASLLERILRIGGPAALDGAVMWSGHFLFLKLVGHIGSGAAGEANPVFAAHMIVVRLEAFTYLPANAWAAATATMIGQALGARQRERALRSGHEGALQCGLLTAVIGLTFLAFAHQLCAGMHNDPTVVSKAAPVLGMVGFFQPVLALTILYLGALRGAGDTVYPLLFTAVGLGGVRLPIALLATLWLGWGLPGAWAGVCVDLVVRLVLAHTRFRRGNWLATKV